MLVGIINTGIGNVGSVKAALNRIFVEDDRPGHSGLIRAPWCNVYHRDDLKTPTHFILPGVGAYSAFMAALVKMEIIDDIREMKRPFLGICVGMQVMGNCGYENGYTEGLGIIPGKVVKMTQKPLPHMGWNACSDSNTYYFVHSYSFITTREYTGITCVYNGGEVVAAVKKGNFLGSQFHPEKSSKAGLKFLENWLNGSI